MHAGVAYYDSRLLRHVRADLDDMAAHGFTYVVHCLSEADLLFSKESMRAVVAETKARGLEVWMDPWGIGNIFGGEPHRSGFVGLNPDACQVRSDGAHTDRACPNNPVFHAFLRDWIDAAADIGSDVVFWDEPHFFPSKHHGVPHLWTCRCSLCQRLFAERHGRPMPVEWTPEVQAFREASLRDLLALGFSHARERATRNALCPLPRESPDHAFDDWEALAALPGLDIFGTDPYWVSYGLDAADYVAASTREVLAFCRAHGLADHVWIQGFEIPRGREDEVRIAIEAAAGAGCTNIAVWGYLGCAGMSTATCARPELVWQIVGATLNRLHDRV